VDSYDFLPPIEKLKLFHSFYYIITYKSGVFMETIKEGDIIYSKSGDKYYVLKILKVDEYETYHTLSYTPMDEVPDKENIKDLEVWIWHSPIGSFPDAVYITNEEVAENELQGYFEYLKQTDYRKYLEEKGMNTEEVIHGANKAYQEAYYLAEDKKYEEAIAKYSEAIDLFPMFYEAIDNRAFVKMDLGLWEEAIEDFTLSLSVKPDSVLAEFSIGECYMKMGQYMKAKKQFEKAIEIDPTHNLSKQFLQKTIQLINN
jgi:tetratricopeptide (TPR) repeat protein